MKRHTKLHLNRILYQSIKSERFLESIVSLSKHTFTPFHLGLAIQLHHEFGSRGLVDNLNSHGFCASYSEMRRFLTSVALKEEDSIKEGVYVPDGIVPVCQGGCLIQEGADNIDINTETIYGKGSLSSKPIT